MRVPAEAGEGKATVKITFPDLKTLKVAPGTAEIVIKKPAAEEKPADRTHGLAPAPEK